MCQMIFTSLYFSTLLLIMIHFHSRILQYSGVPDGRRAFGVWVVGAPMVSKAIPLQESRTLRSNQSTFLELFLSLKLFEKALFVYFVANYD